MLLSPYNFRVETVIHLQLPEPFDIVRYTNAVSLAI